jgi:hypothetical protein
MFFLILVDGAKLPAEGYSSIAGSLPIGHLKFTGM